MTPKPFVCYSSQANYDPHFAAFLSFARTCTGDDPYFYTRNNMINPIGTFSHAFTFIKYEVRHGEHGWTEPSDGSLTLVPQPITARYFFAHAVTDTPSPATAVVTPPTRFVEVYLDALAAATDRTSVAERWYKCEGHGGWFGVHLAEIRQENRLPSPVPKFDWAAYVEQRRLETEEAREAERGGD